MGNIIKVKAKVGKQLFYNQDTMFGGYSFYLKEDNPQITLDKKWGNFVVTGNCPQLIEGKEYEFTIIPTKHKKYGDGYSFVDVKERKLTTVEDQQEYLRQVISNKDAQTLIEAYPDVLIIDFIKENKIDVQRLNGIKEAKLKKIKNKLTMYENLQIALVELKDLGISMHALQKLVRHFGTQDMLIEKIKDNIYVLTEVEMFGFKTVDDYAMKRGDNPESPFRIKACFEHIVTKEGNDGHSWVSIENLISEAENLLKIDTIHIVNIINQLKEKPGKFYIQDDKFTLRKYFNYENSIKFHLDRLSKSYRKKPRTIDFEKIEKDLGIEYTDEQKEAIKMAHENGVMVINGKGGTGKTTVLRGIIESFFEDEHYITCALSGKAANVLNSKGLRSSTIHRMLGVSNTGQFMYNEEEKLPYDVVIIDESSMVNSYLFSCILKAIPDGGKVILVGDNAQLPPIGLASVFDDLLQTQHFPSKELTVVHRQAQKSGILTCANLIRDGKKINGRYDFSTQTYGELKDMVMYPVKNREDIFKNILTVAKHYYEKYGDSWLNDFQIITAVKQKGENSVKNLNKELQKIFNDISKDKLERNGYQYMEGDKVIHSGNNYNAILFPDLDSYLEYRTYDIEELLEEDEVGVRGESVFNGTIGKIVYLDKEKKEVLIQFEDIDGLIVYDQQDLSMIELGYAITIHRSQGIGIKNVLVTFDYVAYKMLSKQLVYTAFTRASEKLVVICENGALHKAIETDQGSTRRTFLKKMLVSGEDNG